MKKKSCLIIAVLFVMLQLVSVFAVLPASAETEDTNFGRMYYTYKADTAPVLDGVADELWAAYPASEDFKWVWSDASGYTNNNLKANFKMLWVEDPEDATKMSIYVLVEYTGFYNYPSISGIHVFLTDGDGVKHKSDVIRKNGSKTGLDITYTHFKVPYSVKGASTDTTVTFEWSCKVSKSDAFSFDVAVVDGSAWSSMANYSWNGCCSGDGSRQVAQGLCKLMQKPGEIDQNADAILEYDGQDVFSFYKNAENEISLPDYEVISGTLLGWKDSNGKLYPANSTYVITGTEQVRLSAFVLKENEYGLLPGASVLIEKPTALRFEVAEDAAVMTALGDTVQEKGLLVVETSKLTAAILEDGSITAEELDAAEIAYEKNVLANPENGIYYTVIDNISDMTTSYSACAYIKIKYADDSVKTVYLSYLAENNARSVKAVSEAAYRDRTTVRAEADGFSYKFKVGKDYAIDDYNLSYSPYTKEQLNILAEFKK